MLVAVAFPGCGAEEPPPLVVGLGDSITEGTPYEREASWLAHVGRRERVAVRNCGVAGETTAAIAARLEACARGATVLVVQGGTNDIGRGAPVDVPARNLQAIVRRAKSLGVRVLLAEVLPWSEAPAEVVALNRRIAAIAREERVALVRWHRLLADPRRPGAMLPEHTEDGIHPDRDGHRRIAAAVRLPSAR